MNLSEKLYSLRKSRNLSQEELAGQLGVSRQAVSKWETGQALPDLDKVVLLANFYSITTDELLQSSADLPPAVTGQEDEANQPDQDQEKQSLYQQAENYYLDHDQILTITKSTAEEILAVWKKTACSFIIAIMLCILSPSVLLVLGGLSACQPPFCSEYAAAIIGLTVLLILVACGVGLILHTNSLRSPFNPYKTQLTELAPEIRTVYSEQLEQYKARTSWKIMAGVILCILAAIPVVVTSVFSEDPSSRFSDPRLYPVLISGSVAVLLVLVSIAVALILSRSNRIDAYNLILEKNDYSAWLKTHPQYGILVGLYWVIATTIYLGLSFWTDSWSTTWMVWMIAGICFPLFDKWMKTHLRAASTRLNEEE